MKNETLDELTALAKELRDAIPEMLLHGNGQFVRGDGTAIPRSELLEDLFRARRIAERLANMLEAAPRVTRKRGEDGGEET